MPFNTFTVACSTTPTAIGTFFNHYTTSKQKKSAHPAKKQLSYHEGVNLIRRFLGYLPSWRTTDIENTQVITASKIYNNSQQDISPLLNGSISSSPQSRKRTSIKQPTSSKLTSPQLAWPNSEAPNGGLGVQNH